MPDRPGITSSELATLWITYQQKTMIQTMLEHFIEKAEDDKARKIMVDLYQTISPYITKMEDIFRTEGAAFPVGFTSEDVHKDVPKLYDNGFDIMFLRLIKEISMGMRTLNIGMSFRAVIINLLPWGVKSVCQKTRLKHGGSRTPVSCLGVERYGHAYDYRVCTVRLHA